MGKFGGSLLILLAVRNAARFEDYLLSLRGTPLTGKPTCLFSGGSLKSTHIHMEGYIQEHGSFWMATVRTKSSEARRRHFLFHWGTSGEVVEKKANALRVLLTLASRRWNLKPLNGEFQRTTILKKLLLLGSTICESQTIHVCSNYPHIPTPKGSTVGICYLHRFCGNGFRTILNGCFKLKAPDRGS